MLSGAHLLLTPVAIRVGLFLLAALTLASVFQGVVNGLTCVDFHWESAALFLRGENPYAWFFAGRAYEGALVDATQAPSTIAFLLPFGLLAQKSANTLWCVCNLGWTALFLCFVQKLWFVGQNRRFLLFTGLFLISVPWRVCMGCGQSSMFTLAFFAAALWTLEQRKSSWLTGFLLSVALFKYTIAAPMCAFFVLKRAWIPLAVCGLIHLVLTLALGVWTQTNPWTLVVQSMQVGQALNTSGGVADLAGLGSWLGLSNVAPLALTGYLVFGLLLALVMSRPKFLAAEELPLLTLLAILTDLVLYHRIYDLVVLAFPLIYLITQFERIPRFTRWALIALCLHIFYYSRLSLVLGHPAFVPVSFAFHLLALFAILQPLKSAAEGRSK